ncbi:putative AC9 transposase [Bienertia sinuspersici]
MIQIDEHRRAPVWLHYEFWLLKGEDGKPDTKYAFCKYCREHKYKASSGYGTSNASIHLKSCQAYLKFVAENPHSGAVFDQKVFIRLFAEAIMFHSYSLSIVEHEKLRVMLSYLQPKVAAPAAILEHYYVGFVFLLAMDLNISVELGT